MLMAHQQISQASVQNVAQLCDVDGYSVEVQQSQSLPVDTDSMLGAGVVYLGDVGGSPFYIGLAQYVCWKHMQFIIDVIERTSAMFFIRRRPRQSLSHPLKDSLWP
jgi:uncharacterized protein (DUF779 family)